jgi:hypothetical protein
VFRRGFGESIACPAADWFVHADESRAAQPVTAVRLTTWPEWDDWFGAETRPLVESGFPLGWVPIVWGPEEVHQRLRRRWPGIRFTLPAR